MLPNIAEFGPYPSLDRMYFGLNNAQNNFHEVQKTFTAPDE